MQKLIKAGGFTYLAVLFAVAMMGVALAATGVMWSTTQRREKEQELLFVGNEYRRAIANYYQRTPGTVKRFPQEFNDLLKDNRHLSILRHLRRPYNDPMTNQPEWGIVRAPDGGIMGVYSLAADVPLKQSGFSLRDSMFDKADSYAKWRFVYAPLAEEALSGTKPAMSNQVPRNN